MIFEIFIGLFWAGIWTYSLKEFDRVKNKSLWDRVLALPFAPWVFAWIVMDYFQYQKYGKQGGGK